MKRSPVTAGVASLAASVCVTGCSLPSLSMPSLPRDAAFSFSTQYWPAEPNGHVDVAAGSQPATSTHADLDRDLAIDGDSELLWSAALDLGQHRFAVDYLPLAFSGSGTTHGFTYHGATYPAGDRVSSDLDLETWAFKWDYALSKQKRTLDAFWVGLGAWWWNFDLQTRGTPSGNNESREFSRVYPGVHAQLIMELGEGTTLGLNGALAANSASRRLYDWSAEILYPVSDIVRLGIGYRWMIWDFNETTNDGDFDFKGPMGTLQIRF